MKRTLILFLLFVVATTCLAAGKKNGKEVGPRKDAPLVIPARVLDAGTVVFAQGFNDTIFPPYRVDHAEYGRKHPGRQ